MGRHPEDRTVPDARSQDPAGTGRRPVPARRPGRARRHLLVAGFVLAYLAAGGVTLALGERVAGGGWLALHLVLLGAATNAIVVWSEHFAAALLRTPPASERVATGRALALNLGILGVLVGVHTGRPALAAGGAGLAGAVVLAHALALAARIGRALPGRLAGTVWFYVAAGAALLGGMGLGLWLAGGVAGSADAYRALRLAHVHLNVLGWVGLAVVGTQFTLWPTVLRTRMVAGVERAVRWSLPALAAGLAAAAAGLATQRRVVALAGLASYAAGLAVALVPFVRTARQRPPHTAASWMLLAGMAWLVVAVVGDLGALAAGPRVVDLDGRLSRLVPAVAAGFALQTLTGALTYLLPVVFGGGAWGNRRLAGILELGWPLRVAAVNLGVLALVAGAPATAGWWLAGLGLGSFVPLAAVALAASTRRP
jgi:nitrite reductase (NO-forming)